MNPGSPDKRSEEMNNLRKEDESTFDGKLDLNLSVNKEEGYEGYDQYNEAWGDRMDLNQQGQHGSSPLLSDVRCARQEPPRMESGSPVQSELIYGETGNLEFNDDPESLYPSLKDNQCLETTKEVCSRESRDFVNSSSPVDKDVLHTEMQAGDSADYSGKSPSTKDMNYQGEGMEEDNIHLYGSTSPPIDENLKEESDKYSGNLQYEKIESVYGEEEGGGTDDHAQKSLSPLMVHYRGDETMKDDYHSGRLLSENEKLDIHLSGMQSPGKTLNGSASPVRQISESFERAPYRHQSSSRKPSPSPKDIQDSSYFPKSPKRKDLSSERHGGDSKRIPSEDHLSPARQTSASPRRHLQESKRRGDSPQKRLSISPRRRHSPSDHRRQDRSVSRSPNRHKDSSSRYRRDNRYRSRSRSPYVRDRYRGSPRRRYSPKRRSPPSGYHSRHHSSRRRPWSPPPNRSNGIGRPGSNLFVAGFGFMTTERDLERKFSRFGRVKDIRIVRDRRTGESRGFGFLSLERDEDADAAIRALDQTEWNGRVVLVEKSKTPTH